MGLLHPLDSLRAHELETASRLIREKFAPTPIRFRQIEIQEPRKAELAPYLEAELHGERHLTPPDRKVRSYVWVYASKDPTEVELHKILVNLTTNGIERDEVQPEMVQAPIHYEEMVNLEIICLRHPAVLKEIERCRLPAGYKACMDPWMYGTQSDSNKRRLFQCYMYVTLDEPEKAVSKESNHYARPLDFSPVFDGHTHELVEMIRLPLGLDHETTSGLDAWEANGGCEYAHELHPDGLRKDPLKPLIVKQPEGTSFKVDGQHVTWQKWSFRVGFSQREGVVIHNVTYDGRQLFYRLAVSEMTVPYGDPRSPYHRKQAFDFGDVGIGLMANKLGLGCDCLGTIKYFDGVVSNGEGMPVEMKNVICLHEVDDGILWKHTNYRHEESARCIRNRKLVVQTIATVGNYEYIFAWEFDLAANVHLETRATGILSTMPIWSKLINGTTEKGRRNAKKLGFGTVVSEGVMAANHQHLFSVRIDPMIDGHENAVMQEESHALPDDDEENPWNVGYVAVKSAITRPGHADLDSTKNRIFSIVNPQKYNAVSGKQVGYKLHAHTSQMILMNPKSYSYRRAYFGRHPIFVTKYRDDELYAAGEFTNQSTTDTGLAIWSTREEELDVERGSDVVLWHTFSLTHNPRPEDMPVMPAEIVKIALKPSSFFEYNPSNDVQPSQQAFNQSALHEADKSGGVAVLNSESGYAGLANETPEGQPKARSNGHANGHANGNTGCCD